MGTLKKLREYSIGFKGLKDGNHEYDFVIKSEFFKLFDAPLYEDGNIKAHIELNKGQQMLILDFFLSGSVASVCDNCLEPVDVPVDYNAKLYVKFGEEYEEPAEDIVVLPREEHEINMAQYLYDFIVTSLPIRHLHPVDKNGNSGCNPEMVRKLSEFLVDREPEGSYDTIDEHDETDPRWNELKKLMNKNK